MRVYKIEIYVPTRDRNGEFLDNKPTHEWYDKTISLLTELCGGCTVTNAQGYDGISGVRETALIVSAYLTLNSAHVSLEDVRIQVHNHVVMLKKELDQECCLYVILEYGENSHFGIV